MNAYENEIMEILKGDTPKKKYDFLVLLIESARKIAYPRRGTEEMDFDIHDASQLIQKTGIGAE